MTGRWTADVLVIFRITGDLAQRMTFPVVGVANTDLTVAQLADLARKALEAKEPVIEVEYLRYANFAMAELWHRDSVAVIQITMAQQIGVADRGSFYDQVGALRDVVQNHLLQVLALVAMDPPVGPGADDLRDKKAEVLRAMPAAVSCPIPPARWRTRSCCVSTPTPGCGCHCRHWARTAPGAGYRWTPRSPTSSVNPWAPVRAAAARRAHRRRPVLRPGGRGGAELAHRPTAAVLPAAGPPIPGSIHVVQRPRLDAAANSPVIHMPGSCHDSR
jgi:hypothetical protein